MGVPFIIMQNNPTSFFDIALSTNFVQAIESLCSMQVRSLDFSKEFRAYLFTYHMVGVVVKLDGIIK